MSSVRSQALFNAWKDAPKGVLSWFSTQTPPPLIPTNLMDVSPWCTYCLLKAEPQIFAPFHAALVQNLGKHSDRSLEEAVKVSAGK